MAHLRNIFLAIVNDVIVAELGETNPMLKKECDFHLINDDDGECNGCKNWETCYRIANWAYSYFPPPPKPEGRK